MRSLRSIACILAIAFVQVAGLAFSQDNTTGGVTVQLPILGVSVDAAGVLAVKAYPDADGRLMAARRVAAIQRFPQDLQKASKLRKISLRRLEVALADKVKSGQPIDAPLKNLAGLQRVEFVFVLPDSNDIIIAGPAEPWMQDLSGRTVGTNTGLPTLQLDDLLVALRTFPDSRAANRWVACSINPTADGIQNLNQFQKQIPARVPESRRHETTAGIADGLRNTLGMMDVVVYGVNQTSNLSRVMVEADYRMKLIAIGLEPAPQRVTTFISALKGQPKEMQRWWLTPDYKRVKQTADKQSMQLVGRGVELKTENITFGARANVNKSKRKPSKAARTYAQSFTKNFETIAKQRPVFAQLRNVVDLLVVSAWLSKTDAYMGCGWRPNELLDESRLPVSALPAMKKAPAAANAVWKRNVLLLPVGGGVSIQASEALKAENLVPDENGDVSSVRKGLVVAHSDWWWD